MIECRVARGEAEGMKAAFLETLGVLPEVAPFTPEEGKDRGAVEVMTAMGLVLMVPPCVVACLDLAERLRLVEAVRALWARLPRGTVLRSGLRSVVVEPGQEGAFLELAAGERPAPLYDVFLSSAPEDRALASELATALIQQGLRVWWRGGVAGVAWTTGRWNAQRLSRATVVLLSAKSEQDPYLADERVRGLALKRDRAHQLLPIYRDGPPTSLDQVPAGLAPLISIDLRLGVPAAAQAVAAALGAPLP